MTVYSIQLRFKGLPSGSNLIGDFFVTDKTIEKINNGYPDQLSIDVLDISNKRPQHIDTLIFSAETKWKQLIRIS